MASAEAPGALRRSPKLEGAHRLRCRTHKSGMSWRGREPRRARQVGALDCGTSSLLLFRLTSSSTRLQKAERPHQELPLQRLPRRSVLMSLKCSIIVVRLLFYVDLALENKLSMINTRRVPSPPTLIKISLPKAPALSPRVPSLPANGVQGYSLICL